MTEPDWRRRDFLDSWTDYNTGTRQVGAWMRQSLLAMGVKPESVPANADLWSSQCIVTIRIHSGRILRYPLTVWCASRFVNIRTGL